MVTCADVDDCLPVFELGFRTATRPQTSQFHIMSPAMEQLAAAERLHLTRSNIRRSTITTDDRTVSGQLHAGVSVVNKLPFNLTETFKPGDVEQPRVSTPLWHACNTTNSSDTTPHSRSRPLTPVCANLYFAWPQD